MIPFLSRSRLDRFALVAILFAGCGKVADPLPPVTSIPEAVTDFSIEQSAYQLVLHWTNPSRNVDQTPLDDLDRVLVRADGEIVAEFPVTGPGQSQTARFDARDLVGAPVEYTLELGTDRDRRSNRSAPVRITAVDVPGPVSAVVATVDQNRIALEWLPPGVRPDLVTAYRIYRSGILIGETPELHFDDNGYVDAAVYDYEIVPVGGGNGLVEGIASESIEVRVLDSTPPGPPSGLRLTLLGASAFLVWQPSPEPDVDGYRVFRRDSADGDFVAIGGEPRATTSFTDPEFQAGAEYVVTAIDRAGNESQMSAPSGR